MEADGDGVRAEGSLALVSGAGTFGIEPCGGPGDDRGAVGSGADFQ